MRLILRKDGNHDPLPLHRIAPVRPVCLDRLCPDYQKRAARTIPLRRFCLFIFSRRRLRCRLDHVSSAAIEKLGTVEPSPKATLHTHVSDRITPVARACRATQRTYLDGVNGARREAGDGHRTRLVEDGPLFETDPRCCWRPRQPLVLRTTSHVGLSGPPLPVAWCGRYRHRGSLLYPAMFAIAPEWFWPGNRFSTRTARHRYSSPERIARAYATDHPARYAFCSSPRLPPYRLLLGPERQSLQSNHPQRFAKLSRQTVVPLR